MSWTEAGERYQMPWPDLLAAVDLKRDRKINTWQQVHKESREAQNNGHMDKSVLLTMC